MKNQVSILKLLCMFRALIAKDHKKPVYEIIQFQLDI